MRPALAAPAAADSAGMGAMTRRRNPRALRNTAPAGDSARPQRAEMFALGVIVGLVLAYVGVIALVAAGNHGGAS